RHCLICPEQDICEVDPPPCWRIDDEEGHRKSKQPPDHQDGLSTDAIGGTGRDQIDDGLRHTEAHDERGDCGLRAETEVRLAQEWQPGPLQTNQGADERIQDDEQRELREVLPQSEPHFAHVPVKLRRRFSAKTSGWGGRSARTNSTNSSFDRAWSAGLKRRSEPMVEPGLPLRPSPHAG